jgi:hypothetical protein
LKYSDTQIYQEIVIRRESIPSNLSIWQKFAKSTLLVVPESEKTILVQKFAERIGVPFIELNDVMWNLDINVDATSTEVRKERVSKILDQRSWIV